MKKFFATVVSLAALFVSPPASAYAESFTVYSVVHGEVWRSPNLPVHEAEAQCQQIDHDVHAVPAMRGNRHVRWYCVWVYTDQPGPTDTVKALEVNNLWLPARKGYAHAKKVCKKSGDYNALPVRYTGSDEVRRYTCLQNPTNWGETP